MRLDAVTAEIRPRSDLESVDLGLALVRRDFWRCLAVWWMAMGLPAGLLGWWLWDRPLLALMIVWWFKPVGSRMVLFQLSRRLFGEQPPWRALWREVPRAWTRRFWYRLLGARLSPFLPVTLPVEELEGVRGEDYRRRSREILGRGTGVLTTVYLLADLAAGWFGLALFGLAAIFVPQGQDAPWTQALEEFDPADFTHIPVLLLQTFSVCVLAAMSLTDVWLTGAGFGLYVNTRTWVEGWDVELVFRRLGERLTKAAGLLVLAAVLLLPPPAQGRTGELRDPGAPPAAEMTAEPVARRPPAEVIREVKADPDFVVHKVTRRVPKARNVGPSGFEGLLSMLGTVVLVLAVAAALGWLGWLLWQYRHTWTRPAREGLAAAKPQARVVMGMAVTPESLPPDLPAAVWALWQDGQHHEALALLYRGTIAKAIESGRVEIREADTEGDCLRRVEAAGEAAAPGYFKRITRVWIALAYAGHPPASATVAELCHDWPFAERRPA